MKLRSGPITYIAKLILDDGYAEFKRPMTPQHGLARLFACGLFPQDLNETTI